MSLRSISCGAVAAVSALLLACGGSNDDKPGSSASGGAGGEGDTGAAAAGEPSTAGSSGKSTTGGSSGLGGSASGGADATSAGTGDGGEQTTGGDVDPPTLDGDGISWKWNGKTYTANKKMHNGWFSEGTTVNISGSDTEDDIPPNMFQLHLMPNKTGTFQCSDYVTPTDSSFSINWLTFDSAATPPNPGFAYDPQLPCEFTITRADKGDTAGDVFEGTFKASLRYPGNGVYMKQDRLNIVGTMRLTKQ